MLRSAGSASRGNALAIAATLIETAKLNDVAPMAGSDTLARIRDCKITVSTNCCRGDPANRSDAFKAPRWRPATLALASYGPRMGEYVRSTGQRVARAQGVLSLRESPGREEAALRSCR